MSHATIIAAHFHRLLRSQGVAAVISRGEATCDVDKVLLARADAETLTSREARFEADRQDVIVEVSDYAPVAEGEPAAVSAPEVGDQITVTVAEEVLTLDIRPSSTTEQHCRHTDSTRQFWRIHTTIVHREAVL